MRLLAPISVLLLLAGVGTGLLAMQRSSNQQSYDEYGAREAFSSSDSENGRNEYSWSRLRYSMDSGSSRGFGRFASWSRDYPQADREFLIALQPLTGTHPGPV